MRGVAGCLVSIPTCCLLFLGSSRELLAGGLGISTNPDLTDSTLVGPATTLDFHLYKVPFFRSPFANRDIEFLWSDTYAQQGAPLVPPGSSDENDLDRFGFMLCEEPNNAFGFDMPDIRLVYNYLNARFAFRDSTYNPEVESPGFQTANENDPLEERNHVDAYLWLRGVDFDVLSASSYPSDFVDGDEDVSTPSPGSYPLNAFDFGGPPVDSINRAPLFSWTRPSSIQNVEWVHEFEHAINNDKKRLDVHFLHMLASAAEVISGANKDRPRFDVPYQWNLIRGDSNQGNYQAWQSFAAYVAYNFRGADTTAAGQGDDLLWRWARQPARTLTSLIPRLSPSECAECTTRTYFQNRSPQDRFHLLVHNWRVAQFVNNCGLAQGQYCFPPQFGFDPIRDVGNWRDIDTAPNAADSANIPMEITVGNPQRTRDLSQAGRSTPDNPSTAHVLSFEPFGADYWIVKSDPSLWDADHELVVRVAPDQIGQGRISVTAVGYSQIPSPGDSLWKHPEWATQVFGPAAKTWNAAGGSDERVELVVSGFGATHKAVLVVLSSSSEQDRSENTRSAFYRLNLAVREYPFLSPNPLPLQTEATYDDWGVLSARGDQAAFVRTTVGGLSQIYRKSLTGGAATPLYAQSVNQFYPDWSPRGDWVVFEQEATGGQCDLFAYNVDSSLVRQLTVAPEHDYWPAFSPNGQRIVYFRAASATAPNGEVRIVDLDGSNDVPLVGRAGEYLRWSRDGMWIYFLKTNNLTRDSLYAVAAVGPDSGIVRDTTELLFDPTFDPTSYDPPPASGRWLTTFPRYNLIEGGLTNLPCPNPKCVVLPRVVGREVQTMTDEALFYRTGASFFNPRWSLDGTRVAYTTDQLGSRDIFVGQAGYNHAPAFSNGLLQDAEWGLATPAAFWLTSSDPDGEPVTYETVYLPPGASLSPAGYFSWPSPGPLGAEYYVVFRAIDPSGGVDHRVVKYTVGSGGGGCPFADTRTASGWQVENSLLSRSLTNTLGRDAYRLKAEPANLGGRYHVRLRENEQEYTTLDQVRLVTVDHPAGSETFALGNSMVTGSRVPAARVTTQQGEDVTALVTGLGTGFAGAPGDTLLVEWTTASGVVSGGAGTFGAESVQDCECPPGVLDCEGKYEQVTWRGAEEFAARPTGVALDQSILETTGIAIQRSDGQGGWRTVERHYPREAPDGAAFDSLGQGPVRLVFVGRHRVRFIGRLEPTAETPTISNLNLHVARHSRLGNVKAAVANSGGSSTSLVPGDTLSLEFTAPSLAAGLVREWFLVNLGVYSSAASPTELQEATLRVPLRFALEQNQPNPFRGTTTIQYELPAVTAVRLEVFDAQGRRVRVLEDGAKPAGFHVAEWDRRDASGAMAKPGVYLYRMTAGAFRAQRKMVLLP